MSAVAEQQLCQGCGKPVMGRRFCNGRCKDRYEASQVYPKYVSTTIRQQKCMAHGAVYEQVRIQFSDGGAARTGVIGIAGAMFSPSAPAHWNGDCPECSREEYARLEAMKPKPNSACEARTCKCAAPDCRDCGKKMSMGPGSTGWHQWVCNDMALVEDKKAEVGIGVKPFVAVGSHRRETWTAWGKQ